MKKIKNIAILGVASMVIFAACKKTDNGPDLTAKEKSLTSRIWKLESLTVPDPEDATKAISITVPCSDSALVAFDIYKNFQIADASKHCDSTIVPYDKGTWKLSASNDSLTLKGHRNFLWKISKLNDTMIVATFRDSTAPTKNYLKTITLK